MVGCKNMVSEGGGERKVGRKNTTGSIIMGMNPRNSHVDPSSEYEYMNTFCLQLHM